MNACRKCRFVWAVVVVALVLPAAQGQDGDAIAMINGQPLARERLVRALIESHGLSYLQQLIVLDLARQESKRRNLRVTQADVDAEYQDALSKIAADAGIEEKDATLELKTRALKNVLENRGVTMTEYMLSVERNAHLRKVVEPDIVVTEETLREEFSRTHGERVQVRHIQIPVTDRGALAEAQSRLKNGEDFAEVARQLSRNADSAPRGGEMAPFGFKDADIPAGLREAAFSLKPGEYSSPIQTDRYLHILKLEQRLPSDDARFEDARAAVERGLRRRVARERMESLMVELYEKAKVVVIDPLLKPQYEQFLRESKGKGQPSP